MSEVDRLWADHSQMTGLTGWTPDYGGGEGFRRGLSETIDWFRDPAVLAGYKAGTYNL
jgi:dTDP-glucose 4,6-dehydratase